MLEAYFKKYNRRGVLIDTNLILLLFVGGISEDFIQKFDRTDKFTADDYQMLLRFIDKFDKVITTPNIMTEVSNLVNNSRMYGYKLKSFFSIFAKALTIISEEYLPSKSIATNQKFYEFGLTDIGIMLVAKNNYLILTTDAGLVSFALCNKIDAVNFNHMRFQF